MANACTQSLLLDRRTDKYPTRDMAELHKVTYIYLTHASPSVQCEAKEATTVLDRRQSDKPQSPFRLGTEGSAVQQTGNPTEARYGKGTRLPCADHAASLLREPGATTARGTNKQCLFRIPNPVFAITSHIALSFWSLPYKALYMSRKTSTYESTLGWIPLSSALVKIYRRKHHVQAEPLETWLSAHKQDRSLIHLYPHASAIAKATWAPRLAWGWIVDGFSAT